MSNLTEAFFVDVSIQYVFLNPNVQASTLAISCDCTDRFMSDLVRNPKDRFSHVTAQVMMDINCEITDEYYTHLALEK